MKNNILTHISLFTGIGGFNVACDWLGILTIMNCEIDEYCTRVLKELWPGVPVVKDVNNAQEIKAILKAIAGIERSKIK